MILPSIPYLLARHLFSLIKRAGIHHIIQILGAQFIDLGTDSLEQCGNNDGFVYGHRHITYPELDCVEERVYTQIPPYFFCIVNAVGFHQQLDIIIVIFNAVEKFGYTCAWKLVKHFCAEGFVPCWPAFPKGELVLNA